MIPKPLYESLPIIYVVSGIFAMTSFQTLTSFVSGLAIGMAGLMVLSMRRKYRNTKAKTNQNISAVLNNVKH